MSKILPWLSDTYLVAVTAPTHNFIKMDAHLALRYPDADADADVAEGADTDAINAGSVSPLMISCVGEGLANQLISAINELQVLRKEKARQDTEDTKAQKMAVDAYKGILCLYLQDQIKYYPGAKLFLEGLIADIQQNQVEVDAMLRDHDAARAAVIADRVANKIPTKEGK